MIKLILADDHPFTLMGIKTFVESLGYVVLETCTNGITALNLIIQHNPDIAILDINMPGITGLELLEKLKKKDLRTKVILVTMHNEMSVFKKAQELGTLGYILKEYATEELGECIQQVLAGKTYSSVNLDPKYSTDSDNPSVESLSFAEKKILQMIAKQLTSSEIANSLFISERTVETHRRNIIHKLNLPKEKNALLIWALKNLK